MLELKELNRMYWVGCFILKYHFLFYLNVYISFK